MLVLQICIFCIIITVSTEVYAGDDLGWMFTFCILTQACHCVSGTAVELQCVSEPRIPVTLCGHDSYWITTQHRNIINYLSARLLTWCSLTAMTHQVRHTEQGSKGRNLRFDRAFAQERAGLHPKMDVYWSTMYYFYASVQHSDSAVC